MQQEIEDWIENEESTVDYQDLYDQTALSRKRKININTAKYDELSRFPFLSTTQILAIINHRKKFGLFLTVYELQVIEEIDDITLRKMMPFIEVVESPFMITNSRNNFDNPYSNEILCLFSNRLEKSQGYFSQNDTLPAAFEGNSHRYVFRYRGDYNNKIAYGFTGEKDAGESFFNTNNPHGFDFNSFYLNYRNEKGFIRNISIGDFQAAFGQGLTFASGLSFGKSSMITNIKRNQNGLRPYRSLNENDFLRGAGLTLAWNHFTSTVFYSRNRMDATVVESDTLDEYAFSSFGTTGLHRTQTEMVNKNSIERSIIGGNLTWHSGGLALGYTLINTAYENNFEPQPKLYNHFKFTGNNLFNHGLNYSYLTGNLLLFGEVSATDLSNGISFIQGALISLGKKLDFAFIHRNIAANYQYTYSSAFTESSTISNENGSYLGFVWRPHLKWNVNLYYDIFSHDWLRYRVDAPSVGHDFLTEVQYSERKKFIIYCRLRFRNKAFNTSETSNHLNDLNQTHRLQSRLNVHYFLQPDLSIKVRVEWVRFENSIGNKMPQLGSLAYFDITKQVNSLKTRLSLRFTMFNIDSYDTRIYTYESAVLYSFSVTAFQNSGSRVYLLSKTRLTKGLDLWVKVSRTVYNNVNSIGSGVDKIIGNKATDIKVQLRWRL
ncbi:MAG: helix-hairpin-helix domain-containing protein [Bacteroidetes bacterium]|nr:helix-hairpin-helix domain-containing protein [Bacteroidota bacterium]